MLVAQYNNARVLAPIDYAAIVVADEAALTSQFAGGVRWHPGTRPGLILTKTFPRPGKHFRQSRLIIPGMMNAFGVFMMRQYASDLPDELIEAARVDGAGEFHIFLRMALPLLPALASVAIIVFIGAWGNFLRLWRSCKTKT
jgi:Binding-protein-dependent transport system inner membrane component